MDFEAAQYIRQATEQLGRELTGSLRNIENSVRYSAISPWDLYFAAALQARGSEPDLKEIRTAADIADLAIFERAKRRGSA